MNLKDPRVIKTLRQIDDALLTNLKDHPFAKITVDMLCDTALINRSTFYKYYQDKYDLLDQYLQKTLDDFRNNIHVHSVLTIHDKLDDRTHMEMFNTVLEFIKPQQYRYQILWNASLGRSIYTEMTQIIHENVYDSIIEQIPGSKKQLAICDLYANLFAINMMAMVQWWFSNENQISEEDIQMIMKRNMNLGIHKAFQTFIQ